MILPVIMAGGTGSRLWPMSRELYPKQFLKLHGDWSMLQETILRLDGVSMREPLVISNEEHRFVIAEQLRKINKLSKNIILEPVGRNTAPAIALAALKAVEEGDDPILLVLAADHVINKKEAFHQSIKDAEKFANAGHLVTFGIVPTHAETGYGYIHRGESVSENGCSGYRVSRFVEKPSYDFAEEYVNSGEYYWNSGMFMFRARKYLSELKKYRPDILKKCEESISASECGHEFTCVPRAIFSECPDESIDFAVMEKTNDAIVIGLNAEWSDVGSWSALWDVSKKDQNGNALNGDVFASDAQNCYVNSEEKLVALVGVDNLAIINTKDAVLVVNKDKVQDVKKVVEFLKNKGRKEYKQHREKYRPWGICDVVVQNPRFIVNKITVIPGGSFSYQKHHHRTEHWIILSGTAEVVLSDKTFLLTENQSTFIPIGVEHSLNNPGKISLEMLEVQAGSYLDDDDIIRIKDLYGRH
ncbi:mannose-1-phosphate guanylyltransferase/mannose-6-phosphate isomerase [Escherichia coli]|uniref:mannose-1-phosphate guanylyltransferase/mannose-6-phosphate isomerase n=1 Tax=Citrobacter sp. Cb016 TaxID=2985015 RepID=UPI00257DC563|nr:mannose-1-phosphate guanylyltransferase/mannose-6-phosphate isomerase [Citrobacter sp. Cb016]ELX9580968.1 mannose-1-phosphate guanylyltransferase/mannose-6-phosphate isomerase [Escherichia coli]MDM3397778.1 mannose-1-phosphate guanylyltransferase/mannose-6-phosphate isomerase [Citrobacter sp. Cb016]